MVDLRSVKQLKLSALEKLGITQLGEELPKDLTRSKIDDAIFFLNQASEDYLYLAMSGIDSAQDKETAYNQYDRCNDLLRRLREYRAPGKI